MSVQSYSERSAVGSIEKQKVQSTPKKSKFESEDPHGPLLIENIQSGEDEDV